MTRVINEALLSGESAPADTRMLPFFKLAAHWSLPGVDSEILVPRNTYTHQAKWQEKAIKLACMFKHHFIHFTDLANGMDIVEAG